MDTEGWKLLLEQQNKHFMALLQAMKTPTTSNSVQLPVYDPDKQNANARAWISTSDICMGDQPLHDAALVIELSRALKGQASEWFSSVSFSGMTWNQFKDMFQARYDCPETSAAFLINVGNTKPKEGECLASFAASMLTSLLSRWKNLSPEQIAVATVLAQLSQFEPRVQRLAFTTEIEDRNRLQQELKALSFLKRRANPSEVSGVDAKRFKAPPTNITCFKCGRVGHKSVTCRYSSMRSTESSSKEVPAARSTNNITCFKCGGPGHFASRCLGVSSRSESSSAVSSDVRRVDVCQIDSPSGTLTHFE
ncbi:uncharacterized protein LOC129941771 [Eupeodes corollae]|uniref:uncharacterized protein LOC129941771 n=1 Tax=Eupeodes corollae TaxID=290404 RepID=UPI00249090F3|nr:uncharacterized protein LOC129941771 [Eupeodes corollae]